MPALGLADRLRELLVSRRFLWALTILLGVLVVLYFLFVTFFFNPFEADLEDTAAIVPREVDYFLRWQGAGERFERFPEPRLWRALEGSETFRSLEQSGRLEQWGESSGIAAMLADLRAAAAKLPAGMSLERDLLREVALAGRGRPALDAAFDGVLMLRVSFRVKAAVALLGFDFVRAKLPNSLAIESLGGGRYRIPQFQPFGYQDAYLARSRDVLLLASRPEWLDLARDLEIRSGEGSLAQASLFHDNVTARLAPGDRPLELLLRWEAAGAALGRWPDAQRPDFAQRVLGRFFSTDLLRYLAGYWLPGARFQARVAGEVDLSRAGEFQRSWYEGDPIGASRIREYAARVPADSFLFASASGDVGRLLLELYASMDEEPRRLLEELVANAGKYQSVAQLLGDVSEALSPGVFLCARRFDFPPDMRDPDRDDRPVPVFVAMANLRNEGAYRRLEDYFKFNSPGLASGDKPAQVRSVPIIGGVEVFALESLAIPGTGELLLMQVPALKMVLFSNNYRYLDLVLRTTFLSGGAGAGGRLGDREEFQRAVAQLQKGANAFVWIDPSEARAWLDRVADHQAPLRFQLEREAAWDAGERAAEERRQRERLFPGSAALSEEQEAQVRDAVIAALERRKQELAAARVPEIRAEIARDFLPIQFLDWLALGLRADRREVSLFLAGALELD